MEALKPYAKFVVAIIGAVVTWAVATFPDNLTVQTYVSLASAILTAVGVYLVPNKPSTNL
jgi:low affinity Fe/Cu permease